MTRLGHDRSASPDPKSTLSALPSVAARALAFTAIVVGGLCGAVIGYGIVKAQCTGDCAKVEAAGAVIGALVIGVGIAVVAVLVLRAMGEWNVVREREARAVLGSRNSLEGRRASDANANAPAGNGGVPEASDDPDREPNTPGTNSQ